jgi:hypothetical protein
MTVTTSIHMSDENTLHTEARNFDGPNPFVSADLMVNTKATVQFFIQSKKSKCVFEFATAVRRLSDQLFEIAVELNSAELEKSEREHEELRLRVNASLTKDSAGADRTKSDAWNEGHSWYPEELPRTFRDEPETDYTRDFISGWEFHAEHSVDADFIDLPND